MTETSGEGLPFQFSSSGEPPWDAAEFSYASWIPNVSGHLSFGVIDGRGKCRTVNQHCCSDGERVIVAHERRSAQDFPLPGQIVGLLRKSVTQDFLIVGNTSPCKTPYIELETQIDAACPARDEHNGVLVGEVLILPPDEQSDTNQILEGLLANIHEEMDTRLDDYLENPPGEIEGLPAAILDLVERAQDQIACFRLNFAIFRTGEVRLWFDMDHFLGRDVSEFPPTKLEEIAAEALPSQAYYFLKDVFHYHYHHDPRTDQLLDITRLDPGVCSSRQDLEWRINILRGLAKVVVEYRQSPRHDSNKKALGVLAYADAFQSLLARVVRKRDLAGGFATTNGITLYDFEHTKTSLEALDALAESKRGAALQLFGIFVGVILSALALWAGAVQIQPILCDDKRISAAVCPPIKPGFTTDLVNTVVSNPLGFVVALTILGGLAYIFLFKGVTNIPFAKPILRFVRSLSAAIGAETAKRSNRDKWGYYAQIAFLTVLTLGTGVLAYLVTPKNNVEPVHTRKPVVQAHGPWGSLDQFVGRRPLESGLLSSSVISSNIRDVLGADYELFLANMTQGSVLKRQGPFFWVVGNSSGNQQNAAYLVLNRDTQQVEIGIKANGRTEVYRSTGAPLVKPADIQRSTGSFSADIGPFPLETSVCKTSSGGSSGGAIQLSGALGGVETCTYRLDLRKGQILSYSPLSARGLTIQVAGNKDEHVLEGEKIISADGTYQVVVSWTAIGGKKDSTKPRRNFYVRLNVR